MNLKSKIIAIALSAATAASMLPQMAMAKITGPAKDDYLFWADFENGKIPSGFELPNPGKNDVSKKSFGVEKPTRWTAEVVDDGTGNEAIKYTFNKGTATAGGKQNLMYLDIQSKDVTNSGYMYGFKIKGNGIKTNITQLFKPYRFAGTTPHGYAPVSSMTYKTIDASTGESQLYTMLSRHNNMNVGTGSTNARVETATVAGDKWLEVTVLVQFVSNARVVTVTYKEEGASPVELNKIERIYCQNGMPNALYSMLLTVDDTNAVTEALTNSAYTESFYIDDIWAKELGMKTITFDSQGGSAVAAKEVMDGLMLSSLPTAPTKDMAVFKGWYTDKECTEEFDINTPITANITLYAKWLPLYKVTFHYNNGIGVYVPETTQDVISQEANNTEIELIADPERAGYEFKGWYLDNNVWENPFDGTKLDETSVDQITHAYAKWETAFPVKFDTNGGNAIATKYTTDTLSELPTPTKSGYHFEYWYREGSEDIPFDGQLTSDEKNSNGVTVYAKWTKYWVLNFDSNGGSSVSKVLTLEDLTKLPESSMSGKGFDGWYWDEGLTEKFDGSGLADYMNAIENEDDRVVTVYAKWSDELYNLDFEDPNDEDLALELMKQLAPNKYQELIDKGFGIADDGTGNHVFKIAYEGNSSKKITRTATLPITPADGLEGLYEVSYVATFPETFRGFGALMQPQSGGTNLMQVFTRTANPWFLFQYNGKIQYQMLSGQNGSHQMYSTTTNRYSFKGGVEMRYLIDTVGNTMTAFANYTTMTNTKGSDTSHSMPITSGNDLDALLVFSQTAEAGSVGPHDSGITLDNIVVKKITPPEVDTAVTTIKDGDIDVPVKPTINIGFTQDVDVSTLTTNNIYIQNSSGTKVESVLNIDNSGEIPVVSLTPMNELERDSEYTLYVTKSIKQGDYPLVAYTATFETVPYQFQITEASVTGMDTGTATAKLSLRNFSGKDVENYFVAAALVDTETGEQFEYHFATGTINLGEDKPVLDTTFDTTDKTGENYKIKFYIWDSIANGFSLWKEDIVRP